MGFDARFAFGPDDRWTGYLGRDVLRGLVAGIDEFHAAKARERRFRILGSALLGAFTWLDDPELVQRIAEFPYACVVITKQPRDSRHQAKLARLQGLLERSRGFPASALPELEYPGSHTFEVRAIDNAGNVDPSPASRTWTIELPDSCEQMQDLIGYITALGLPHGAEQSLTAKVSNARRDCLRGQTRPTCNKMNAFENEVRARTGHELTQAEAAELILRQIQSAAASPANRYDTRCSPIARWRAFLYPHVHSA